MDADIVDELGLADPAGGIVQPRPRVVIDQSLEAAEARRRAARAVTTPEPRRPRRMRATAAETPSAAMPSEDAVALTFVERHGADHLFIAPSHRWMRWDGQRWAEDSTGHVFDLIRRLVRELVKDGKAERSTACAQFVGGVERLLRHDQSLAVLPEHFDADPWLLNTRSGIVDLQTGKVRPHDRTAMLTKITGAGITDLAGLELWMQFLRDITCGDAELMKYLQRVAGYCATGATTEDILAFLFGIGANGKSSFAEAVAHALGDYAMVFSPEVLMEARGERHPTELAQFQGVRFALTSEPASSAAWNDSRIKSMTGDATISARVMRGDPFMFPRTHKTIVIGNHMPRLGDVSHAIRRRVQMVPFRAVFEHEACGSMRERLKAECGDAILAWVIDGAKWWQALGTMPPPAVRELTADYLAEQDVFSQWLRECCEREQGASERASVLHRNYQRWCERQGLQADSVVRFVASMTSAGFRKRNTSIGRLFDGLRVKPEVVQ